MLESGFGRSWKEYFPGSGVIPNDRRQALQNPRTRGNTNGTFGSGLSRGSYPTLDINIPYCAGRRASCLPLVLLLVLASSSRPVLAEDPNADTQQRGDTVSMAPIEVKSDPFRTLGIHGAFIVTLTGKTHMNIGAVNPGSPAAKNGLRADDEIVEIEGKPVGIGTLFAFRKMVKDAEDHRLTFECTVRSYRSQATHPVLFQAMREPRHRWLPVAQSIAAYQEARDPMAQASKDSMPDSEWQDRGNATPQVALVSLFCAFGHGDVDRVSGLLDISANDLTALSGLFHSLPDAGQRYYGSPERMLAAFVDQEARPRWIRVRTVSSSDPDRSSLEVTQISWNDLDRRRLVSTYSFRRTAAGWKWAISSDSIKRYADYYRGVPFDLAPLEAVPEIAWFFRSN